MKKLEERRHGVKRLLNTALGPAPSNFRRFDLAKRFLLCDNKIGGVLIRFQNVIPIINHKVRLVYCIEQCFFLSSLWNENIFQLFRSDDRDVALQKLIIFFEI